MSENLDPNIDSKLNFKQLRPALIIKGYIKNEASCNYENYLLELLNHSSYFRSKGKSKYNKPVNENNGQCDAIAKNYELDFKLLLAATSLQASNIFSPSINNVGNGITTHGECKNPNGEIKATQIQVAFRTRNLSDLLQLEINYTGVRKQCIETDILKVLNNLKTSKNLLLYFPVKFWFDEIDVPSKSEALEKIMQALNYDFESLFEYRNYVTDKFDTYFVTIYLDSFYIFKIEENKLKIIDNIKFEKLPTFIKLSNCRLF
ncbi:hypothetical protein [Streptococcus sanguinis]|uniref:hypothetical protein n=1 Tax=Streptococcus sanguinis TaxID=1305 RepID=UPI000F6888FC|nr:hypothetical protein [Streptococcus sanguinis]RSI07063.1 hypothetical protein D8889_08275 [Streptococcus sanguinis]